MMFVPLVGFAAPLRCKLSATDALLPLDANDTARLATALAASGSYTRLTVGNGSGSAYEVVRVTGVVNGQVVIEREQEGTSAINAPAGACAAFAWTPQNL